MFRPWRTAAQTLLTAALGVGALGACSGGDAGEADPPPASPSATTATTAATTPTMPTTVSVGTISGRLDPAGRARLRTAVTRVVDAWVDAAYVAGDYPRTDFADAFASFTPGARERALDDSSLMSNAGVGERVDVVEVLRRTLSIDVLAPAGRPAGVTASVGLTIRLIGEVERRDRIVGDLYLTRGADGWQVFGYDVRRGAL